MGSKHIAIDLGAESGRVMVGEVSAGGIGLVEMHRFANVPVQIDETWRWDILRLWREIRAGLAKVVAEWGAENIASIGVDTWGLDFALLDDRGELVANPVCYRDARTRGVPEQVFARISRQRVYEVTGIQTMEINTLFQLAAMAFSGDAEWRAARRILFLPDLLTYWLCGQMGTEYTNASTSQMLDARRRTWSAEIFSAIGGDAGLFPEIGMPAEKGSIRGAVLPAANEALAAAGVKVVAVGSHDTASAVVAVPAGFTEGENGGDWLYLSSGTWSLLGAEVDEPVLTEVARTFDLTNEGGVGGKIRLLKNIAGLWLLQECRREWARHGMEYDYAALTEMAHGANARGGQGTILDLSDSIFATTGDMPAKIVEHCRRLRLAVPETPGEFVRVILESLAAMYARVARMLSEATGREFKTLHIVGGGSQNDLLNQLAADATGMTVLAGPVEATALGNVICQAISLGKVASIAAGRDLVARSMPVRAFRPGRKDRGDARDADATGGAGVV